MLDVNTALALERIAVAATNCTLAAVDKGSIALRDDTYAVAHAAWAALLKQVKEEAA